MKCRWSNRRALEKFHPPVPAGCSSENEADFLFSEPRHSGLPQAASPESILTAPGLWIPGLALRGAPE
jgi:hypothetical protein